MVAVLRRSAPAAAGRLVALVLTGLLPLSGCSSGSPVAPRAAASPPSPPGGSAVVATTTPSPPPSGSPSPGPLPQRPSSLPLGGRSIFPRYRVVAFYGSVGGPALGVLGKGTPERAARAIERVAASYAAFGRPVQPAMELIATVAQGAPGPDGTFSRRIADADIDRYLAVARRHRMLLLLDVQPGRADFLSQVRSLAPYLRQPDVGIALDPEWTLTPTQRPLRQIGSSRAAPVNAVSAYVAALVARFRLPQKLFVVHQFQVRMLPDREAILARPGLAMVFHVDGQGPVADKRRTYAVLRARARFHLGFKLFYVKDPVLMTPAQAMALRPRPELVTYQ